MSLHARYIFFMHVVSRNHVRDNVDNKLKEQVAYKSQELCVDKGVKAIKKETKVSRQPQRTSAAINIASKSTTSKWIKFDIVGKTGIKLPSLALVDLEVEKSFMSYGTWVLSGQPSLDKAKKTIQASGKSSEECIGMVQSTIHINSQSLEGEF